MKYKTKKQLLAEEVKKLKAKKEKEIDEYIEKNPGSIYTRWRADEEYYKSPEFAKQFKKSNEKKKKQNFKLEK